MRAFDPAARCGYEPVAWLPCPVSRLRQRLTRRRVNLLGMEGGGSEEKQSRGVRVEDGRGSVGATQKSESGVIKPGAREMIAALARDASRKGHETLNTTDRPAHL
ncbi:hypothetical protein HYQ46_006106 [Verticillium longisporum]|nr:hypothetical protein HYQ46_006106 [Verticillium longisporum]